MTEPAIKPYKILICDLIGLQLDATGQPDCSQARAHIEEKGGLFHSCPVEEAGALQPGRLHFFYQPHLSEPSALVAAAGQGQYDAVIAAATFLPPETIFPLGGVRIGAGTGNMASGSWGGGDGVGGDAPLMNTPGINSRATAQMVFKALVKVMPDLAVRELHERVCAGAFDTGRDLRDYPTAKLHGKRIAVLGYGNIGRETAKLAAAFGMDVVVHARERHRVWIESEGFSYAASPMEAARAAEVLSVHLGLGPHDPETGRPANAGFVDEAMLFALAPGAVLINYDRGELVDVPALDKALAAGKIRHAAIDADLFSNAETGEQSGPMLPYLRLIDRYNDRLELLPHAAADTDHPSRVAGAIQAVDQIFEAILHKRVVNLKGSLPTGYSDGGRQAPIGVGAVSAQHLGWTAQQVSVVEPLIRDADVLNQFWRDLGRVDGDQRAELIAKRGEEATLAANRLASLLARQGLLGPFAS